MTVHRVIEGRTGGLTPDDADAMAARLVDEMAQRWRRGERPLAEEFIARCPEPVHQPQAAADLICEEFSLRGELGAEMPVDAFLNRFPQWRNQLEVMLDCQRLLEPQQRNPQFPSAGEALSDFLLLRELGRGIQGRVFLARQRSLAERPVVLKLTPGYATEHLSLARLQHTNIVPLYSVQDYPVRNLRGLCMPYFGGATLADILQRLRAIPPCQRTGRDVLDVLGPYDSELAGRPGPAGTSRHVAIASYPETMCRIAICLADAMQYAHERGLLHLDLKPSNVLIAADGQPMVLDFHLARRRIAAREAAPEWFGGTAGYMSPEQCSAFEAARRGQSVPEGVDERSDVYSLGAVLHVALGGDAQRHALRSTVPARKPRAANWQLEIHEPLDRLNPQVSAGLADIVSRCLASNATDRYPSMAAVAADLRRHLAHLPLRGVRNRSVAERWRKWRRRRPHGVATIATLLLAMVALAAVAIGALRHVADRIDKAESALVQSQSEMARQDWRAATQTLSRGLSLVQHLPWRWTAADEMKRRLAQAERGLQTDERNALARKLRLLADRIRGLYGADPLPASARRELAESCRQFWQGRSAIIDRFGPALPQGIADDFLDVAIFRANLLAAEDDARNGENAIQAIAEAERQFGTCAALTAEMRIHGKAATETPADPAPAHTAWQHYALARAYLRSGELKEAQLETRKALEMEPRGLWPNFYYGLCAYRSGRHAEAVAAFSVCIALADNPAVCFYNRALAYRALGLADEAAHDQDQALRFDPSLTAAARERLQPPSGQFVDAVASLARSDVLAAVLHFIQLSASRAPDSAEVHR